MRHFILTFFCSFLSSGYLQAVNNADNSQFQKYADNLLPTAELPNWPVEAYQTFQSSFFGTARRSIQAKACQDPTTQPVVSKQSANQKFDASSTRRSFNSKSNSQINSESSKLSPPTLNTDIKEELEEKQLSSKNVEKNVQYPESNYEEVFIEAKESIEVSTSTDQLVPQDNIRVSSPTILEIEKEEVFNREVTTDRLLKPATVSDETPKCSATSNKEPGALPEASRRFLINSNNQPTYQNVNLNNNTNSIGMKYSLNKNNVRMTTNNNGQDDAVKTSNTKPKLLISKDNLNNNLNKPKGNYESEQRTGELNMLTKNNDELRDPTVGDGISLFKKTNFMAMDFERVCYACSSTNNPTCLAPDRKTTVKYCRKGTNGCVTKTFGTGSTLTLIRDCGNSCHDVGVSGFNPRYKTCSVCNSDLCNSAFSHQAHSLMLSLPTIAIILIAKPLF